MKHTINLDDELSLEIVKWATREDRSFNNLVERLLRKAIIEEQQSKERSEEK